MNFCSTLFSGVNKYSQKLLFDNQKRSLQTSDRPQYIDTKPATKYSNLPVAPLNDQPCEFSNIYLLTTGYGLKAKVNC